MRTLSAARPTTLPAPPDRTPYHTTPPPPPRQPPRTHPTTHRPRPPSATNPAPRPPGPARQPSRPRHPSADRDLATSTSNPGPGPPARDGAGVITRCSGQRELIPAALPARWPAGRGRAGRAAGGSHGQADEDTGQE